MALQDRASDETAQLFELKSYKLRQEFELYQLPELLWEFLAEIKDGLELMTANYSYGNGEVTIDLSDLEKLDFYFSHPELIDYYLIYFTRKYLDIELSDRSFRHNDLVFWYETVELIESFNELS